MALTSKTKKTKGSLARFLETLWKMVNDEDEIKKCGEYISWNENGTGIIIKSRNEFASHILPIYFNTQEFASFHRQLTNYGFKKPQDVEKDEFVNENFIRGSPELLKNIIKKKPPDKHQAGCSSDSGGIKQKGSSARRTSVKTHPAQNSVSTSLPRNPQNPTLSGEGPTLKCTYEQTSKRSDHQPSKKTRTTTGISKHKNPATRMHPYPRLTQWSQKTPASEKDNSIQQIKPQLSILPDTPLFAQNNTSATPNQKSLEQSLLFPAGALTSELLFPMSNLGITNATPLQPHSYHVKKFPQPHLSVNDRENSHQDSNVRRPPTSSQSSFMFGSIAHPKQTTDVSRQGTVEIVYTNLTGLTDKQLEPEHVRASASNHEVLDPMGTTPSSISDLESDASILSWITPFIADTTSGGPDIDVFDDFSESTDIDDFQLENGGSRGDGRVLQTTPSCDEDNQRPATHPITLLPPCHPSAPPLNMELNFVEEHQTQGNNTVQMPTASKILQVTAPDDYGTNSDPSYTGIGSGYDSTSSGLGNSLDPTETTETTDGDTVLNPSQDNLATENRTKISIDPSEVDMQGGGPCRIKITPELSSEVQSVRLEVGLGTTHLSKDGEHYEGSPIPPSDKPGWNPAVIRSQSGERIGDTWLYYRTKFETALAIVLLTVEEDPSKYPTVLEGLANTMRGPVSTISSETPNCGRLESTRTVQVLLSLLYKAAEFGAQRFVKMLLNSPFGRSIFHEYKKSALLPEVIARNHGHEHTALYLEGITNRFSQEIIPSDLGRIDWSRFLAACNAREDGAYESPQPDGINDSDNSYLGDVESLSCDSAEPMSDSEDGLSEMFSKVSVKENDIQKEETTAGKDENEITHRPSETQESNVLLKESINKDQMSGKPVTTSSDHMLFFLNKGKFSRKEIAINRRGKASKLAKGEHRIFPITEHFNCNFPDLPKMRSMDQPIFWYLLTIDTDSINRFLSTMEDRRRIQLQLQRLSGRITTSPLSMLFQAMHIDPEEGTLSFSLSMLAFKVENTIAQALKSLSTDAGLSTSSDDTTRATCKPFDSPLPSNNSTPSDIVALTSVYRPSGKILLSFVSDRNGFLPPESWFEDEDCELMMECWKWRRCKNNFLALKVIEIKDQPASSGIRAQGRLATGVYKRPLCEQKGLVKRVPENVFGRNWTGKTSLKTSLVWRTNKSRENTEPEPEFLFEEQTSQLIYKRSLKKVKSHSSYAEDLSWNPNCSVTVPLKVIEKAKELSKPTDMSLQDCREVENEAKDDSQEPSTKAVDPSLKLRVPKQPEDIKDYLMTSVYPSVIVNTNYQKTLSCAHADNPYHKAEPKHLVVSFYGTIKDNAYSKRLKDPLVVDTKKSESSENLENILSFAERLSPTIKDLKKPQPMRGDVTELKSVIGEKQQDKTKPDNNEERCTCSKEVFKTSNDTEPRGCCNVHQQFMETEEMRNPMPDKLTLRSKASKISNDTQPPGCRNVHQQFMESEEMRNPMPDKWTLRSKGNRAVKEERKLQEDPEVKLFHTKAAYSQREICPSSKNFANDQHRPAIDYLKSNLKTAEELGDRSGERTAYGNLGTAHHRLRDLKRAIDYHERHLKIAKELGDISGEGTAYGNLGNVYSSLGDFKRAKDYHKRHLKIAKELGDISGEGTAYGNRGNVYSSLEDFERAEDHYERRLKIANKPFDGSLKGKASRNPPNGLFLFLRFLLLILLVFLVSMSPGNYFSFLSYLCLILFCFIYV